MATDYNAIVETITKAQQRGDERPAADKPQVTVDRLGGIRVNQGKPSEAAISEVQHGTFAVAVSDARQRRDAETARTKLPPGTYYEEAAGAEGWYYSIVTPEFRNEYVFCASFDGLDYKVRLIAPDLEARGYAGHGGHLYPGGKICLSKSAGAGQPSLETAYSKSVLWAHGMDFVRSGVTFPFSYDQ
ncbi:hypothetical protein O7628_13590 [Micromonospora sp. WMMD956]|uniref:hypothetical protein n=1 Tax=Micromonospora sp. WMMD956 TaxID=3016108 RepID=UPI002415A753|nr:hypothetical protein [Micromonospora sp. WMMD956]MDG4816530.1 hypothetical protein [Micromonospora sp. WMMD956]